MVKWHLTLVNAQTNKIKPIAFFSLRFRAFKNINKLCLNQKRFSLIEKSIITLRFSSFSLFVFGGNFKINLAVLIGKKNRILIDSVFFTTLTSFSPWNISNYFLELLTFLSFLFSLSLVRSPYKLIQYSLMFLNPKSCLQLPVPD